jgi:hypothetical protein
MITRGIKCMHLEKPEGFPNDSCEKLLVLDEFNLRNEDVKHTRLETKIEHFGEGGILFAFDNAEHIAVVAINSVHMLYC